MSHRKVRDDMTREELLEEIDRERKWLDEAGYTAYNIDIVFSSLYKNIKALEQEPKTGWITVSERLPDGCDYRSCYEVEDGAVLWTNEDGLVGMGYYYESTKTWSDIEDNPIAVIAWMPLPEPYRESEG